MRRPLPKRPGWLLASVLTAALLALAGWAQATVIERVVALVGDHAIFLSDLKHRARPLLLRIYTETPEGAQRAAAISQVYKSMLDRMIDEELMQRTANQQRLAVTPQEVDAAIDQLASSNNITKEELLSEAARTGYNASEYRQDLRRQLLEAKLLNPRLQGRIRLVEEDLVSAYQKLQQEERQALGFQAAWILIDGSRRSAEEAQRLATSVASQARSGDFAALAARYSDDTSTKQQGGVLPATQPGQLAPAIDRSLFALDVGQVSAPIRVGDSWAILKVLQRQPSQLPPFKEAQAELQNRVYVEKLNAERKRWMENLRRQTHVEVRL